MTTHGVSHPYTPSALGGGARRFLELTTTLARTEFKLRYYGSFLGYLWSLIRPLLFFGVIYLFFTQIIHLGKSVPHYGVYLLTGIVLWSYFAEVTGNCVNCLVARESLLRKVRFPRLAVPVSVSLTAVFNLVMNLIPVLIFALASGVTPRLSWLELGPIIAGFIVLATGIGLLLATLYVSFRDVRPIWEIASQILFYCSPIMYVAANYRGLEHLALLSPIAFLLTETSHAFIGGPHLPSATHAAGPAWHSAVALAFIPCFFALGYLWFSHEAPSMAENL